MPTSWADRLGRSTFGPVIRWRVRRKPCCEVSGLPSRTCVSVSTRTTQRHRTRAPANGSCFTRARTSAKPALGLMKERWIPMMTRTHKAAWVLLATTLGCSSPAQTSSSSHWVSCASDPACTGVSGAVACDQGYCVDANHQRVEMGDAMAAGPGACDPLLPHELPITLGTLLGVGQDARGTVYAADH